MKNCRSINGETDTVRPAKVRRLEINNNHQITKEQPRAPHVPQHLSFMGSNGPMSSTERHHDDRANPTNDESALASMGSASRDSSGNRRQESLECCCGMVCIMPITPSLTFLFIDQHDT